MAMRYELFFANTKIGIVTEVDADFPNLWGRIEYDATFNSPVGASADLSRFITLNRESIRLTELQEDTGGVEADLAAVDSELQRYTAYVESEDWRLVDENGNDRPILVPIFRDSEIIWRWNTPKL